MRFASWLLLVCVLTVQASAVERAPGSIADLADRLVTGLRVKAPADVAFCGQVADLVQGGELPVEVVDATYTWAIGRGKKYPFPAFQHVIRLKAAKLGVPL
ncbi:MAG: hypothetical protein ACKO1M_12270 [Planctomycetota bacterium]